jgi:hypothetical protein
MLHYPFSNTPQKDTCSSMRERGVKIYISTPFLCHCSKRQTKHSFIHSADEDSSKHIFTNWVCITKILSYQFFLLTLILSFPSVIFISRTSNESMTNVKLIIYLSQSHTLNLHCFNINNNSSSRKKNVFYLFMSRNSFMSSQKSPSSDENPAIRVAGVKSKTTFWRDFVTRRASEMICGSLCCEN